MFGISCLPSPPSLPSPVFISCALGTRSLSCSCPGDGTEQEPRSCAIAASPESGVFQRKITPDGVASGAAKPGEAAGETKQPLCSARAPHPYPQLFFSLPEAAQRLRAFAGSLCTKTGRGDGAGFFVANVGQGKGGS